MRFHKTERKVFNPKDLKKLSPDEVDQYYKNQKYEPRHLLSDRFGYIHYSEKVIRL